jgi:SAM-dependent methyltransferase
VFCRPDGTTVMNSGSVDSVAAERIMALNAEALATAQNLWSWNLGVFPLQPGRRILDVGCGPCLYWREIVRLRPNLYLAADVSEAFLAEAQRRLEGQVPVETRRLDLNRWEPDAWWAARELDDAFCFDVLEHIEDDVLAARKLALLLRSARVQRLFVRVPALPWIYGRNDAAIGHYRRYSRSGLRKLLEGAGLPPVSIGFHNVAGILPWFVIGRLAGRAQAVSAAEGRLFDAFVPMLRLAERLVPPPIGLSLYAVCSVAPPSREEELAP